MENYSIIVYWSEQDGCFLAEVPDLPGCIADGTTEAEARQDALESAKRWVKIAQFLSLDIPLPSPALPGLLEGVTETRRLSNRDRDIFLALLDADPEPTLAAQEIAVRFNKGRHEGGNYHFHA